MWVSNLLVGQRGVLGAVLVFVFGLAIGLYAPGVKAADNNWYIEGSYSYLELEGLPFGVDFALVFGAVGYHINEYLSAEVGLGTGVSGFSRAGSKIDIQSFPTISLKPYYRFNDLLEGFLRLGLGRTKLKLVNTGTESDSDIGTFWGLGLRTNFTKKAYGAIEYVDLGGDSEAYNSSFRGITVAVGYNF